MEAAPEVIALIDYGAGNLGSVLKALKFVGAQVSVTSSPADLADAEAVVLPGVGAFSHCMGGLAAAGMLEAVSGYARSGRPFLGICVGLQMLFDESDEPGGVPGLGILRGRVARFDQAQMVDLGTGRPLKIPHIGWNSVSYLPESRLFHGLHENERFYFVHSYHPVPDDPAVVSATSDYGYRFCAAIERGNLMATQFHPEKSGTVGLKLLANFLAISREGQ